VNTIAKQSIGRSFKINNVYLNFEISQADEEVCVVKITCGDNQLRLAPSEFLAFSEELNELLGEMHRNFVICEKTSK